MNSAYGRCDRRADALVCDLAALPRSVDSKSFTTVALRTRSSAQPTAELGGIVATGFGLAGLVFPIAPVGSTRLYGPAGRAEHRTC